VARVIDPAREDIVLNRAATPFEPGQKASSHVARDLELDGATGLLLNNDRSSSDIRPRDDIANPNLHQVAAAKLAVDRKIEQGTVTNATLAIEEEADGPNLFLRERTLGSYLLSSVPSCTLAAGIIELRMAHVSSPRP
jgi:hypothetical protein